MKTSVVAGASTQSRASRPGGPVEIAYCSGAEEFTVYGRRIISWPMGQYGPLLGYPSSYNPHTVRLIDELQKHMARGLASLGSYAPYAEKRLAETLGERFGGYMPTNNIGVRFFSNGTDATQAAVAIARFCSPRREKIISIGYHGGSSPVFNFPPQAGGVLRANHDACINVLFDEYPAYRMRDNFASFLRECAAVVVEIPSRENEFETARILSYIENDCKVNHVFLIMDEIVTGFRYHRAGALGFYGNIKADFVCLGKAMSTYGKISALLGPADMMECLRDRVFASYTYSDHPFGMYDALVTIDEYENIPNLYDHINLIGNELTSELNIVFSEHGFDAYVYGHPSRTAIKNNMPKSVYWEFLSRMVDNHNILIHQPNFVTYAHDEGHVKETISAARSTLAGMGFPRL